MLFKNNKCWRGCGENGNFVPCWWEWKWCSHYGNSMEIHKKIKNRTTIWSSNSTWFQFWGLSEENEDTNLKRYMHLHIHCSIVYNNQDMEVTWLSPMYEWIKKMEYVTHIWNIIQPWKEWNIAISNNMDGSWRHYAKWNKLEKDKYWMIPCICGT